MILIVKNIPISLSQRGINILIKHKSLGPFIVFKIQTCLGPFIVFKIQTLPYPPSNLRMLLPLQYRVSVISYTSARLEPLLSLVY